MSGKEVKEVLIKNGYTQKGVAELLGTTQQNFSQALQSDDIKTGLLERICDVLNKKIDFFYLGTKYVNNEIGTNSNSEIRFLQGQIAAYKDTLDRIGQGESFKKEIEAV